MISSLKKDIVNVLSEELNAYKEILEITSHQINMIKAMDMNGLHTLFQEKDKFINKIERVEANLTLMLSQSYRDITSDKDILSCLKKIEITIQDIIKIEESCFAELAILQAGVAEEIRQTDKGVHASKAYNPSDTSRPRFFDVRS